MPWVKFEIRQLLADKLYGIAITAYVGPELADPLFPPTSVHREPSEGVNVGVIVFFSPHIELQSPNFNSRLSAGKDCLAARLFSFSHLPVGLCHVRFSKKQ